MKSVLKRVERAADMLIAPALVLVFFIITAELFFTEVAHEYHDWINLLDYAVIGVFAVDLSFKSYRASTWEGFLKKHWLEIIAILPFFMVFRVVEFLTVPTQAADLGQDAAHLAEGARSGRFAELFRSTEATRSTRFSRFLRAFSRSPRLAKAADFFKHPDES